jgi:hypothetical protein
MKVRSGGHAGSTHCATPVAMPLYFFLVLDIVNGSSALVFPGAFAAPALVLKAALAVYLAVRVRWSVPSFVQLVLVLVCVLAYAALLETSAEATALLLKCASVVIMLALLTRFVVDFPTTAVERYLRSCLLVIALSLGLGLLGIGHDRYGDDEALLRANGFLLSGNEMNLALVGLFWWLAAKRKANPRRLDLALYWLCLALMIVSTSKTTIVAAFVTVAYFSRGRWHALVLLVVALPAAAMLLARSQIWERWVYFFHFYADEGIFSALTGGRFGRIETFIDQVAEFPLAGVGVLAKGGGYIESDPLDLLLNFGAVGVVLYVLYAAALWQGARCALVPWLLVMVTSVLAGHVVYSVFAAPILLCAFHVARRVTLLPQGRLSSADMPPPPPSSMSESAVRSSA